jgi:hypothetical protein
MEIVRFEDIETCPLDRVPNRRDMQRKETLEQ